MPRVKITPRRVSNRQERETDNMDESILDDEEVERLEQELNSLRREKAKQIRKMRFKREERRKYGHSSYSSNESDTEQYSDQEDVEESGELDVTPRQSTRDLADGFEKAQKRFMFNIRHIEEKYRERELRGLPESKIEIDRHGRFYFPENMAACHQQAFVNRMFQYDSLFGKGSVSAPRNSIQSFDGDSRALKKSQQLDEKFGRKLRPSEVHNFHDNARKGRIVSSAHVSGIPLFVRYSSEDNDRRDTSQFSNDYDDDVFEPLPREHRAYNQKFPGLHGESMFSSHEKNSSEEEEMSDDEETTDNEEGITENEDETTDSSTETSDEEDEEEGSDKTTKSVKQEVVQQPTSRQNASEKTTPVGTKNTRTSPRESTTVSPQKVTMIVVKSEVVHQESLQREKQAPESTRLKETTPIIPQIPIKREISSVGPSTPRILRNIATSNTPSRNIIDGKCVTVANVEGLKIASTSETVNSKPEKPLPYSKGDIRKFMKPKPVQQDDSNSKPACDLAQSTHQLHEGSNALETLDVIILPTLASADRPKRTIKPTEKAVNLKKNSPDTSCSQSHETISKKRNSETKCQKQNRKSSPYCKHCEILAEEEKKAKQNAKLNKSLPVNKESPKTSEVPKVASRIQEAKPRKSGSKKDDKFCKNSELGSSDERLGHSKRRSDTAASGGPEKKKQKLVDSDLLSIPSSLAIVVDTDLIVTENPSLASSSIPKFSDKCPSPSRWSSNVDDKWIEDLKRVQSNAKVPQLLGVRVSEVPENVPLIKIWVDNLNRNKSDKDPFEKDIRRLVAQDKKARLDLKAGYDVRG